MSDIVVPPPWLGQRPYLGTVGVYSMTGGQSAGSGGSAAWPVANTAFFIPVRLPREQVLLGLAITNGATVSGNVDMGLYTLAGKRIVSTGSTVHASINVAQRILLGTPLALAAEAYYFAIAFDNTTALVLRFNSPVLGIETYKLLGMAEQANAFPLPDPATPGPLTQFFLPIAGLVLRGTP